MSTTDTIRRDRTPAPPSFRPDIEGLRAIAVGLVVLAHLTGWPSGGFVGVDVFFVISGYLITGLLVREHARSGRISWRGFYVRRVRRIMPVALLTLAVTVAVSWLVFTGTRAAEATRDALYALGFAANLHFASLGTNYFDANRPESPLQHFWSLAVEEQFYVVWPVVVLVALTLGQRRRVGSRYLSLAGLAILGASLVWSLHETAAHPTQAYFSTTVRAWELGVGAVLAVHPQWFSRTRFRPALAWLALAGIVLSAFLIGPATPFPGTAALLPVLATGLLLATSGDPRSPTERWALGSPPMRYLGRISYSLYLWHWPVFILAQALLPAPSLTVRLGLVALSVAVSSLSYFLVERPVLESGWLLPGATRQRTGEGRRHRPWVRPAQLVTGTGLVLALAASAFTIGQSGAVAAGPVLSPLVRDKDNPVGEVELTSAIAHSVAPEEWGELHPALDHLEGAPEMIHQDCADVDDAEHVAKCRYGPRNARHHAVLVGDSFAASWMPGVRAGLEKHGWDIQMLVYRSCPNVSLTINTNEGRPYTACDAHKDFVRQHLRSHHYDLMVLADRSWFGSQITGQPKDRARPDLWEKAAREFFTSVRPSADRAVVLGSPPGSGDPRQCATKVSSPEDCTTPVRPDRSALNAAEARAARSARLSYVGVRDWFCYRGRCPAVVGDTPVYWDGSHLSAAYSELLGPMLGEALLGRP
ncbi:acyltransferase family protein [Oryzihumus sp.]|uniref:acyltransferase family protein n=1 Tax=Oryzihumus sp. TaxID=1968903 RepID=UPI002ED9FD22